MQKNTDIEKEETEHVKGLAMKQPVQHACRKIHLSTK